MLVLAVGLAIFFFAHLVPMVPALSAALTRALGESGRKIAVSIDSAIGLALIIWGKAHAPLEPLWPPPTWGRDVAHALMPIAFVLLAAAYVSDNHIRPAVRNPMLAAIILWATAHLFANGDRASALLFGGFLAFAVVDWWSVSRRPARGREPGRIVGDFAAVAIGLTA